MCNLYSITRNQAAIRNLFKVGRDTSGNPHPLPAIFPDQMAPVVRINEGERELTMMRWGMPNPPQFPGITTNIRNTNSPHWQRWLIPEARCFSLDFLQANFGKAGSYYYWISRGIDGREVRPNRNRKSVGAENTFANDLTEFEVVLSELQPLIDKVWRHCEDKGARGRTVTLKVKFADFELISRTGRW
jgi:hypothetical protein